MHAAFWLTCTALFTSFWKNFLKDCIFTDWRCMPVTSLSNQSIYVFIICWSRVRITQGLYYWDNFSNHHKVMIAFCSLWATRLVSYCRLRITEYIGGFVKKVGVGFIWTTLLQNQCPFCVLVFNYWIWTPPTSSRWVENMEMREWKWK